MSSDDVQDFLADAGAGALGAQAQASTPDPMQIKVDPEIAKARRRLQLLEELKALAPAAPDLMPEPPCSATAAPTAEHIVVPYIEPDPVPQEPVPVPRATMPVLVPQVVGQPAVDLAGDVPVVLPPSKPPAPKPTVAAAAVKPLAELTPDIECMIRDVTRQLATRNWLRVWTMKTAEGGWPGTNGYPSGLWLRVQARAKAIINAQFIETWVRFLYANRSKVWSVSKATNFVGFQATNFALLAEVEAAYGTKQRAAGE